MPSDTRYARAATARRSPNARLYSAVPRSSQWPSIVTVQVALRLSSAAFSSSVFCPSPDSSSLSYSKKTGFSGEFLLISSSDTDDTSSGRTGSGGTTVGSGTGCGGAGGRVVAFVVAGVVDGGVGRRTGALFL